MEVVGLLLLFNRNLGYFCAINNLHDIPIGLNSLCHESSKVWLLDSMPKHHMMKVLSENYLSIFVLRLEVVASNGHDELVCVVIDVACYGGAIGDLLVKVKHNSCILEITASLHLCNQINSIA